MPVLNKYGSGICAGLLMAISALAPAQEPPLPRTGAIEGKPWPRRVIDDRSRGADGARLLDVNGDGLLDIATAWEEGGLIRVYLHPGTGAVRQPWPAVTVGRAKSPEDAVLVDLDRDGSADVVSAAEGEERTVYIHWGPSRPEEYRDPAAWRTAALPDPLHCQWMFTVPAQIDGANGPDLVAGAKNENAGIGWFLAPSDPRQIDRWTWKPQYPAGWVMSIRVIDIDKDDDLDVVYSDRKGADRGVWWLENPGPAEAGGQWRRHPVGGFGREVMFLDAGDLDADGETDLAVATRGGGILLLTRSTEAGQWRQREVPMPPDTGTGKAAAIADIDLDGRIDLVVSCEAASGKHGVFHLSPRDSGAWDARAISGLEGTKFDLVQLVDLDNDGDLDVLTCEETENLGVIWYENPQRG